MSADDELRALAEGATPGRWKGWGMQVLADQDGTSDYDRAVAVADTFSTDANGRPRTYDADWIIATQPENILGLLNERDELRAAVERAEAKVARVEALVRVAEYRTATSLGRDINGRPFESPVPLTDLRAALTTDEPEGDA